MGDLWTLAGCAAVEVAGGPKVPHELGRVDAPDDSHCPPNGRLPDASQGAAHLRDVFGRMGFNDQEIVCLSGGHTWGRCHIVRSGFDGPWTSTPLTFNNEYFTNLMNLKWRKKEWDGPEQFEDVATGKLMILPTDMALKTDPKFRVYTELYAKDAALFRKDFAVAFSKLLHLGKPPSVKSTPTKKEKETAEYLELCMHGSEGPVRRLSKTVDVDAVERYSGRSALHKAAFWGHVGVVNFLANELKLDVNLQDKNGDTPLHDATRFGHEAVAKLLIDAKTDLSIRNKDGQTPLDVATEYGKVNIVGMLRKS